VSWDIALAYLTGFRWINPDLTGAALLRTVLVVHITDAILCRLFAHNNGYSKNLWTALGLVFGLWAITVLLLLPKRVPVETQPGDTVRSAPRDDV
jgi:hypothetical protein